MKKLRNFFSSFEPLLDLNTSAALLGVSVSTVTRYIEDGTLAAVTVHRGKRKISRKIRPSTLHAFLAGNATSRPPEGSGGTPPVPPLLPPLVEIRPSVGFDGVTEPPFLSQGNTVSQEQLYQGSTATQEGEADVIASN